MEEVSNIQFQAVKSDNHLVVPNNQIQEAVDEGGLVGTVLAVIFLIRALTDLIKAAKS